MTHGQNNRNQRSNYVENGKWHTTALAPPKDTDLRPEDHLSIDTSANTNNIPGPNIEIPRIYKPYGICRRMCTILCLFLAGSLFIIGLLSLRFTLFDFIMKERLRMAPELPPFQWWKDPKPEIRCSVYIFTVTNPDEFLNGTDSKLKLKEVGPIIYRERLVHSDVEFHENSTMSYTIQRYLEYQPEHNEPGILNRTIVVPNVVLLGMVARISESYIARIAFRLISRTDKLFVNTTIYNYLWNFTTPALISAKTLVPFAVDQDNGGTLYNIYHNFKNRVNVRIGPKHGFDEFFMINTFDGLPSVPGFRPEYGDCNASLQNTTEGAVYPSFLKKDLTLLYWRKTVCRPIPLTFDKEVQMDSLVGYRFIAKEDLYDRIRNSTEDCYAESGNIPLPDGLSDVSRCYHGLPVAVSSPHFYGRTGYWNDKLEGFTPSKEKHSSFAIIEPTMGVPMRQTARSQSNLVLPELTNFDQNIERFSRVVVPLVWMEYHLERLTDDIIFSMIFTVKILPVLQYFISVLILIGSGFYLKIGIDRLKLEHKLRHANDKKY